MSKFVISQNEERFNSEIFDSREDAIEQGGEEFNGEGFYVGRAVSPASPESLFEVSDWLETVSCNGEYDVEWAEDWDFSTKEQRKELEMEVQSVMAKWLDKYDLRPKFFNVVEVAYIPSTDENIATMKKGGDPREGKEEGRQV